MKWYWISLKYATFGICTQNDLVIKTAPIGRWMLSKHISYIRKWVSSKYGIIKELKAEQP